MLGFMTRPGQEEASDPTQPLGAEELSRWLIHAGVLVGLWDRPADVQEGLRLLERNGLAPEAWQYLGLEQRDPKEGVTRGEFTRAVVALVSLSAR